VSGIVGIMNLDGAPVDRELLSAMTEFMAFRGPDVQEIWCDGPIGFGNTLLRTGHEAKDDAQPASLDGKYWITADARIDARAELIDKLHSKGSQISLADPDHLLVLHAYRAWGPACVEHLLGNFAFAIWDAEERKLFCARDHFGLKPFFYARIRNSILFSNTLNCLRAHPEISDKLNDLAIGDFLLFDFNRELDTTYFHDILRLPPAHTLECKRESLSVRRYWTLPEAQPANYKSPQDCLDQFREVFDAAVSDRMTSNTVCVALSGGLDSPTVAASARRVLDQRGTPSDLWSYTIVYNSIVPHQEGYYSGLVAETLRIPVRQFAADQGKLYGDYEQQDYTTPEPVHVPMGHSGGNPLPEFAARGRVVLTGFGADPLLGTLRLGHIRRQFKARKFGRLFKDLAAYLAAEGRFSRLYLREFWQRRYYESKGSEPYPAWLSPEFEKRLNLRDRWENGSSSSQPNNSARPEAYDAVVAPHWVHFFEEGDAGATGYPVEARHPFLDLRVVRFLLALPAMPWCADKEILRRASKGILPKAVRMRKKSPMPRDPIIAVLQRPESAWVDRIEPAQALQQYVVLSQIPRLFGLQESMHAWVNLRPISLNYWLQRLGVLSYNSMSHKAGGNS
jgi:asparagine synthase (glutamine-hydrolysing)